MAESGREALPEEYEGPLGGSGGCPGGTRVVGRPSRSAGNGLEAIPESREWSAGPLEGQGVVGRPSWRA